MGTSYQIFCWTEALNNFVLGHFWVSHLLRVPCRELEALSLDAPFCQGHLQWLCTKPRISETLTTSVPNSIAKPPLLWKNVAF